MTTLSPEKSSPLAQIERQRLDVLSQLSILDTNSEAEFDDLAKLAAQICHTPMASISFLDVNREWLKAKIGMIETEASRDHSFCAQAILHADVMVIGNARLDPRFTQNALVTGPTQILFYAGCPVLGPNGAPLGTLNVMDIMARELSQAQIESLRFLARQITRLLELRLQIHRLQEDRQTLRSKLHEVSKLSTLGEMAGGIAHEINNPLAVLSGRVNLLQSRLQSSRSQSGELNAGELLADLQKLDKSVDRIAKIVRGLRTYARNSNEDPFVTANLATILDETVAMCREKFRHQLVTLKLVCGSALPVECRPAQLAQILVNLLSNAFDVVVDLPEKWIEISADIQNQSVVLSITDSGPGIPKETAEKIMQPFFTTKELGKGTGLGLSISSGLAQAHGGHLTYDASSPYTRFVLTLPLKRSLGPMRVG